MMAHHSISRLVLKRRHSSTKAHHRSSESLSEQHLNNSKYQDNTTKISQEKKRQSLIRYPSTTSNKGTLELSYRFGSVASAE